MSQRYCSHCATALARSPIDGREREHCPACGFVVYRNPAPVGLAVIEQAGELVLICRRAAPLAGHWAPPAGYVECGESVPQAVVREAREECGLDIALNGLIGVYSQADVNVLIVAYHAHPIGGTLCAGDDASEAAWFTRANLPRAQVPADASATDRWFAQVIHDLTRPWHSP